MGISAVAAPSLLAASANDTAGRGCTAGNRELAIGWSVFLTQLSSAYSSIDRVGTGSFPSLARRHPRAGGSWDRMLVQHV